MTLAATPTPAVGPSSAQAAPSPARAPGRTLTFLALAVATASSSMPQGLVPPVLPTIQHDLHTTQPAVSWVLIAWLLSASVATPILGRVSDMTGKKRTLIAVLGAIIAGSLLSAMAPNITILIIARAIQGFGGAVFPIAFGIIRDEFPQRRVPSALGLMSSVIAVGGALGIVLAGPIVDGPGWRWLFWIPMILVALAAVACHRLVPESPARSGGRISWINAGLLVTWLLALLLAVSQGQHWGWGSATTTTLFALAVTTGTGWVIGETRSANPVIDMTMMRLPAVWTTNLIALLFGAAMFATLTFLPQLIQTPAGAGYGFGASVTRAGLLILPMLVTMAASGMMSGPIHPLVGFKPQVALGSALLAAASAGFALWSHAEWQIGLVGAVFGLGLGFAYAATTSLIVGSVIPAQTGAAAGMNTNIRNIGGAIGTAVLTAIVTSHLQTGGLPAADSYRDGFLVLAAMAGSGVLISLLVPTRNTPAT